MKRKAALIGFALALMAVIIYAGLSFNLTPKITISVTVSSSLVKWRYIIETQGILVAFTQNNNTIAETIAYYSPAKNVTITIGNYILKFYEGNTRLFIKQAEYYFSKDMALNIII